MLHFCGLWATAGDRREGSIISLEGYDSGRTSLAHLLPLLHCAEAILGSPLAAGEGHSYIVHRRVGTY